MWWRGMIEPSVACATQRNVVVGVKTVRTVATLLTSLVRIGVVVSPVLSLSLAVRAPVAGRDSS